MVLGYRLFGMCYIPVHVHICLFVSYWFSEVDGIETVLNVTETKAVAAEKKIIWY